MTKLRIYIETSVWNFLFANDALEKKLVTEKFFDPRSIAKYGLYISDVVLAEISDAPIGKRDILMGAVKQHEPEILHIDDEIRKVAEAYLENGLLSPKQSNDILHLAFATVNGLDIILTWNMKHLVKRKTQLIVDGTNRMLGYRGLEIRTPGELMEDDI
jgi:hypothetical protein